MIKHPPVLTTLVKHVSIILSFTICTSVLAAPLVIQQTELHAIEKKSKALNFSAVLQFPEQLEQELSALPTHAETILARAKAIKQMAELNPSAKQIAWVKKQKLRSEIISVANIDHPQLLLTIINIAQQAKTTEKIWQLKRDAKHTAQQWQQQNWQWSQFLQSTQKQSQEDYKQQYASLTLALRHTNAATINWLSEQLIAQEQLLQASNQLLVLLINSNITLSSEKNVEKQISHAPHGTAVERMLPILWKNEADEFSYQHLQKISENFSNNQAVEQLIFASNNPALSSQAFIQLVKHHQDNEQAQNFLIKQLANEKNQWYAAASMAFANDMTLTSQVNKLARQNNSPALTFALSQLVQE